MELVSRIQQALADNRFLPKPEYTAKLVKRIEDFTIPYNQFFTEGASFCQQPWTGRKPSFAPRPRRFRQPLSLPKATEPPAKFLPQGLFQSVAAIWEYYQKYNLAESSLLQEAADLDGLQAFLTPLYNHLPYPLSAQLECLEDMDMAGIWLTLPCMSYDEEPAGLLEAFLTGTEELAGMILHYDEDRKLDLSAENRKLVEEVGYLKLLECYRNHKGEKACDLRKLEEWYAVFFDHLDLKYPSQDVGSIPVITADDWPDVQITCVEDIEFAVEYEQASEKFYACLPDIWEMEAGDGMATEEFLDDVFAVWRKECSSNSTT